MTTDTRPDYNRDLFNLHRLSPNRIEIASVDLVRWGNLHFVRCRSTDGAVGMVMISEAPHFLAPLLQQLILPFFTGKDARDLETLLDEIYVYKWNYKYAGPAFWIPVAWCEAAILDMLGHATGKSVGEILGGVKRSSVPVYISSLRRDTTAEEEVEWVGERLRQTNAPAVKLKIGGRLSRNADAYPGRSERLVALARQQWGPDVKLYIDANGSYDAPFGIEVSKILQEHNVVFFEEPCPFEDLDDTKRVADAIEMPVAGGEQDSSLPRFESMARNRVVDILQPDMLYNGGFIRNRRVELIGRHYGLPVTPHSPYLGPRQALSIHFVSMLEELPIELEYAAALPEPGKRTDWYSPNIEVHNGSVDVPTGPGLGIEFAQEVWNGLEVVE